MSANPSPDPAKLAEPKVDEKPTAPPAVIAPQPDGPPSTVWKLAMSLLITIPICGWLVKVLDDSEFPETFTQPWLWIAIGVLVFLTLVWAWFLRRQENWFDRLVLLALML